MPGPMIGLPGDSPFMTPQQAVNPSLSQINAIRQAIVANTPVQQRASTITQLNQQYARPGLAPMPIPPPPPPKPVSPWEDFRESRLDRFGYTPAVGQDPFQLGLVGFSPLANLGPDAPKTAYEELFGDTTLGKSFYEKLTPEQQQKFEETRRTSNESMFKKNELIQEVEKIQAEDPTLPETEKQILRELSRALMVNAPGKFNEMHPIAIQLRNLSTRAKFRKMHADWKSGKTGTDKSGLPSWMDDITGEDVDAAGGLGGFMAQQETNPDYVASPKMFGYLIHTDQHGEEHVVRAEEWINLKIADATPAPGDTPQQRAAKAETAATLIYTLAQIDVYNSFAKKRDAGYRVELDGAGKPIRAYFHNDDKVALQNFVKKVLAHQEAGITAPIEEFLEAYALEYKSISDNASGPYGDGSGSRDGGGYGYSRGYGGYGGYGGGGGGFAQPTTYFPTAAEVVEPANGVARARLGRALTAEEEAQFVEFFRGMEASLLASGGMLSRLDPQSQAIAWLEAKLNKEQAGQQAGRYIVALMNSLRTGSLQAG